MGDPLQFFSERLVPRPGRRRGILCNDLHNVHPRNALCYTAGVANGSRDIKAWYEAGHAPQVPKIVTGLRGTGKSAFLEDLYNDLRARGVARRRVRLIDAECATFRRCATGEQALSLILEGVPPEGRVYFLLREAASLPEPEQILAALAQNPDYEVVATASSRRLLQGPVRDIYGITPETYEVLPAPGIRSRSTEAECSRWNEILAKDILAHAHVMDVPTIVRLAGWLSDNLGTLISLRIISNAISSRYRMLSPHTVDGLLNALIAANLIEKAIRWDTEEEAPLATGYRFYFTDPELRRAQFGPAPYDETRRMALNRAWLWLRHESDEVFSASGSREVDFVTRNGNVHAYWHVDVDGDGAVVRLD